MRVTVREYIIIQYVCHCYIEFIWSRYFEFESDGLTLLYNAYLKKKTILSIVRLPRDLQY